MVVDGNKIKRINTTFVIQICDETVNMAWRYRVGSNNTVLFKLPGIHKIIKFIPETTNN